MIFLFLRKVFLIILIFICGQARSQEMAIKYCNRISADSIRETVYTLASDSMEGRETGKEGQKKASYFLASKYRSWDLKPAGTSDDANESGEISEHSKTQYKEERFFQDHTISIRNNKTKNFLVGGEAFLYGKDFYRSEERRVGKECA